MIQFDNFTILCDECGRQCSIGVEDTFDGDAVLKVECNNCDNIERIQTEIGCE